MTDPVTSTDIATSVDAHPLRPADGRERVIVLCSRNSARSIMAEALLRHLADDRFEVHSAGVDAGTVQPLALEALEEAGIDTVGLRSKRVDEYLGRAAFAHAIIVCNRAAETLCPTIHPMAAAVHAWPFPDPADEAIPPADRPAAYRDVRDRIAERLVRWLEEEVPAG